MRKLFVDTNIFYNILFRTELTSIARRILEENSDAMFYTSMIVVNELLYISTAKYFRDRGIAKGGFSLRKALSRYGYPREVVEGIKGLLEDLDIHVLPDKQDIDELMRVAIEYRLLPNDAIIALTCRRYGIDTILTFDEDFKRIPWLKVIP